MHTLRARSAFDSLMRFAAPIRSRPITRRAKGAPFDLAKAIVLCVILLVGGAGAAVAQPVPRDWTVMVYMNGKNNLEPDALNNFHAMASVGSAARVAIVAQLGRPSLKHHTSADGNWSGVYRFLVGKGQAPRPQNAVEKVAAGTASDMGNPAALTAFIRWAKGRYPARHYMLIIWNHGQGYRLQLAMSAAKKGLKASQPRPGLSTLGGFRAVSSDDDTGHILYNAEVQQAIAANFSPSDKLDIIGFDACLMAMVETAYAVAPTSRLMVASEELEPGDGWQYAAWLGKLVADPAMAPEKIGEAVVETYRNHYGDTYHTTLSMLRLAQAADAASALTQFADALRTAGPAELELVREARAALSSYADWDNPPSYLSVDLATLLEQYREKTSNAALKERAKLVIDHVRGMVLANYASTRSQGTLGDALYGSRGLAIYYPRTREDFKDDFFSDGYLKTNKDRPIEFVRRERWAVLLYALLGLP